MLRLGLSSGAVYPEVATEEVPAAAARLVLPDLELLLQTPGEYAPAFIARVKANVASSGCRVHALHTFQPLHPVVTPYRRRAEEGTALFRQAIEAAAVLGARAVVWHGLTRQEVAHPGAMDGFLAATEELARACGEARVALAIENVSWCVLASVRDVMGFAARLPELGPPGSIGFAFDPFQAAEAGANPFMILAAMEGHLVDVHLSDHREGDTTARHLPPGDGDLPWPALIRAVAGSGYAGPLMIEGALKEPGTLDRVRAALDPLLASVAATEDPCAGSPPPGVEAGIRLFNAGEFYEAHEAIEHEWHAERRPVRRLYQGILQIGVGLHHARGGNHRGAVLLLTDGIEKTSRFLPACQGIDTARLAREAQTWLDRITALGPGHLDELDWDDRPLVARTKAGHRP